MRAHAVQSIRNCMLPDQASAHALPAAAPREAGQRLPRGECTRAYIDRPRDGSARRAARLLLRQAGPRLRGRRLRQRARLCRLLRLLPAQTGRSGGGRRLLHRRLLLLVLLRLRLGGALRARVAAGVAAAAVLAVGRRAGRRRVLAVLVRLRPHSGTGYARTGTRVPV